MSAKRKVSVVLVDRANYGRLKPVLHAIQDHPGLDLQVVSAGTMELPRFDRPVEVVRGDGFNIDAHLHVELEGSLPVTMAKSLGIAVGEFASAFHRLEPDIVAVIGDRYEALAAGLAAVYLNRTLVHVQGGEISGSIDESARHALTKLAHYHLPATERAKDYVCRMGEREDTVLGVGCPSADLAHTFDRTLNSEVVNGRGAGISIDVTQPFALAVYHPTTTSFGSETSQMDAFLAALDDVAVPTLLMWPNIDAGSDQIAKVIRRFRTMGTRPWLRTLTNLQPTDYLKVLSNVACAVGNSSSFVRDAGFFGTPVVLVGDRQAHRETDAHVTRVRCERSEIAAALKRQLAHGEYPPSRLYGAPGTSKRFATRLMDVPLYVQKSLSYPES